MPAGPVDVEKAFRFRYCPWEKVENKKRDSTSSRGYPVTVSYYVVLNSILGRDLFPGGRILYSASATTSWTSGIMRFIMPSIPAFKVIIEEGHPEQEPCIIRVTTP